MSARHWSWAAVPLVFFMAWPAIAGKPLVSAAWARATPPGATVAAVYLQIDNTSGRADRLLALSSPVATSSEVHRTSVEDGIARMREIFTLHVAAGEVVEFAPGGLHIMLSGLSKPLVAGQSFALKLVFELAGVQPVTVIVRED